MDLVSGSRLCAEVAEERTDATWHTRGPARLPARGVGGVSLGSDRAKALIQLAETGLGCLSLPAVFHLIHELGQGSALSGYRPLRQARPALSHAQERLSISQASDPRGAQGEQAQAVVEARAAEVERGEGVRQASRCHLETLSLMMHPWRVLDSTRQSSQDVARRLRAESVALETWRRTHGLPVNKQVLAKVRTQRAGVAALSDLWWQEGWQEVTPQVALTPMGAPGRADWVLPLLSWQQPRSRTPGPRRKAQIFQALEAVQKGVETHPIPQQLVPEVLAAWTAWAAEHAKAFQRASSAVEGRHGSWSQMHHHQRGLPKRRDKGWPVVHNVDCRAADGSTPASRLFRRGFPDRCEPVRSKSDALPRPRRRNPARVLSD